MKKNNNVTLSNKNKVSFKNKILLSTDRTLNIGDSFIPTEHFQTILANDKNNKVVFNEVKCTDCDKCIKICPSYSSPKTQTLSSEEVSTGNTYKDKLYNLGFGIPNNSSVQEIEVAFEYLNFWDIYFDLNCNGEICEPEAMFTDLLPIGVQRYNFAYGQRLYTLSAISRTAAPEPLVTIPIRIG